MNEISKDLNHPNEDLTFTATGFFQGVTKSLPIVISVVPFGLVFGMMARKASLNLSESTLMSAAVFAGASQLVAVSLWSNALPIFSIVSTTFLVNLRLVLMGASLRPWFEKLSVWQRYGSMFFLTDAGWALQLREFEEGSKNGAFLLGNGAAQYVVWVTSTALGFLLGAAIGQPEKFGLDFVVPASFLALLVGMWRGKGSVLPWTAAIIAALVSSKFLAGNWFILIGGITGSLTGAIFGKSEGAKNE